MEIKVKMTPKEEIELVGEIYENFPEASQCLRCDSFDYKSFRFHFTDDEGEKHVVTRKKAIEGLRLFCDAVGRGELPGLGMTVDDLTDTGKWDAFAFDAVNQMAIYGKVVYG